MRDFVFLLRGSRAPMCLFPFWFNCKQSYEQWKSCFIDGFGFLVLYFGEQLQTHLLYDVIDCVNMMIKNV